MLKLRDKKVAPTEHDIYKFSPVFRNRTPYGDYIRYYEHRERVLTGD